MYYCENCNTQHDGSYGSGRFCSSKCARSYSTKNNRIEINKKVSQTLINKQNLTKQERIQRKIAKRHASYERENNVTTLFDLSSRTVKKILKRMNLPCSLCGWYHENIVCDIHHIIEKKNGGNDDHDNLTYVCPNCHRLIHNNLINKNTLITLKDYIGDEWKNFYYVKNKKIFNK